MKNRKSWGAYVASFGIATLIFGGVAGPAIAAPGAEGCTSSAKPALTDPTGSNLAPVAKVSASSSLAGSNFASVNNLALPGNPATDTGFGWASDPAVDGTSPTLTMTWDTAQRFDATEIFFNASEPNKSKNIYLPKSVVVEYLDQSGGYRQVSDVSAGGPLQAGVKNRLVFKSLATTSLRLSFTVEPGNSVGIAEWYTYSVATDGAPVGPSVTYKDEEHSSAPILDQSKKAEVRYIDGCVQEQPVVWNQADFEAQWNMMKRPLTSDETIIVIGKVQPSRLGAADARLSVTVQAFGTEPSIPDPGIVSVDPIIVAVAATTTLELPAQAKGRDAAGNATFYDVTWEKYDPELLNTPDTSFVVSGYLTDYPNINVSARVDVTTAPVPPPDFSNARITVSPNAVAPGGEIVVSGTGFPEGVSLEIWMHSDPILLADGLNPTSGIFRNRYTIPGDTSSGKHRIEVKSGGRVVASSEFTVGVGVEVAGEAGAGAKGAKSKKVGKGGLEVTGAEVAQIAAVAGIVVAFGAAGVIVARARRRSSYEA